jgi:hypothetical protein
MRMRLVWLSAFAALLVIGVPLVHAAGDGGGIVGALDASVGPPDSRDPPTIAPDGRAGPGAGGAVEIPPAGRADESAPGGGMSVPSSRTDTTLGAPVGRPGDATGGTPALEPPAR